MNEDTKRVAWVTTAIFLVITTFMVLMFEDCNRSDQRRLECVKLGHSPVECKELFRGGGAR